MSTKGMSAGQKAAVKLTFEGGRELEFDLPDWATFSGLCATCRKCDGPMPITRHLGPSPAAYWATCHACNQGYLVTGIEGPDESPTFCMIPYFPRREVDSKTWMGLARK